MFLMYPGQTHCAACRQPLAHPVAQTQHGLMHGACAYQWAAPQTMRWNWIGVAVLVLGLVITVTLVGR
jgi:hypothetical protein